MRFGFSNSWKAALPALLLLAIPVAAQVQFEGANLNLGGDITFGYGGSFGNIADTTHSLMLGGNGQLSGYYYHPNFLSFSVRPYYNRNQQNSSFQLIDNNYGVSSQASFFSGSRFPGTFTYNKDANSTGTLGLPGASALATNGGGSSWTISWSELLPKFPTFTAAYTSTNGRAEVYGTNETSSSQGHSLSLSSTYSILGFALNGTYQKTNIGMNEPGFLVNTEAPLRTQTDSSSLLYGVSHRLPLHGNALFTGTMFQSDSLLSGSDINNNTHSYNGAVSLLPWSRLSLSAGTTFTNNLSGTINQQLIQEGGAPLVNFGLGTDSMTTYGGAAINVGKGFAINTNANHIVQHWGGEEHSATQFSGTATYNFSHRYLGSLTFSGGAVDTATEQGNGGVGLVANVNFTKKYGRWDVGSRFGYSQSVETLLAVYMTSNYNYGANVRRKLGDYTWSSYFSGARSGVQRNDGSNHAENLGTMLSGRRYSFNANWGESRGMSVLTANGLVSTPTLPVSLLNPNAIILYNGSQYGFGASFIALKRLNIIGNYSNASSSTIAGLTTYGRTSMLTATLRYPFRKMYFNAGYTRLGQTVAVGGGSPIVVSSYFFGISRWFDFF